MARAPQGHLVGLHARLQQDEGTVQHLAHVQRFLAQARTAGKFQEVAGDGFHVPHGLVHGLHVLLPGRGEFHAPGEGEQAQLEACQRVADGVGHTGGQFAHQGHLFGLAQVLAQVLVAFLKGQTGALHVLVHAADAAGDGGHGRALRHAAVGVRAQFAQGREQGQVDAAPQAGAQAQQQDQGEQQQAHEDALARAQRPGEDVDAQPDAEQKAQGQDDASRQQQPGRVESVFFRRGGSLLDGWGRGLVHGMHGSEGGKGPALAAAAGPGRSGDGRGTRTSASPAGAGTSPAGRPERSPPASGPSRGAGRSCSPQGCRPGSRPGR